MKVSVSDVSADAGQKVVTVELLCEDGQNPLHRRMKMSRASYESIGSPVRGEQLSEEALAALEREGRRYDALLRALRLLGTADNNRASMRRKLRERDVDRETADWATEYLVDRGLIREEEQIRRAVVQYAGHRLWGPRRIYAALRAKGYESDAIRRQIREAEEAGEIDFAESRRHLIERVRTPDMTSDKLRAVLYRYGY